MGEPLIRLERISKSFGAVNALHQVSLSVEPKSMHAIVGENGAGKTTLMKVLYGATRADEGSIFIGDRPVTLRSSADALSHGIGMVSQHYSVIPELTCLQNLVLGSEPTAILNYRQLRSRADELAGQMNFRFAWDEPTANLSPAAKQKLEILKLLWRNSKVMILDEPTAMLSPIDADSLFESMALLVAKGATVILVTHRLPEVLLYCDRVSVMRGGKLVAESEVASTDLSALAELIVGPGAVEQLGPGRRDNPHEAKPILSLTCVSVKGDRGNQAITDVSLAVKPGEVVGIAGVDGNGQAELMMAIEGLVPLESGEIALLDGLTHESTTLRRLQRGLRIIPEDRHEQAIIEGWSLEENACLGLESLSPIANGPWIDRTQRKLFAQRVVQRFDTHHGGLNNPMASLSGGNQQRLVAARSLELSPKLLLAFQPVRGLDLGATARIYAAIRAECEHGMAALVVSFDLDELLAHCDRVLVLNRGRLHEPVEEDRLNRASIGKLMVSMR